MSLFPDAYGTANALADGWCSFGPYAILVRYLLFHERVRGINVVFVAHVRWIEEALVKAVQLAPPALTISIRIFITRPLPMTESQSPDFISSSGTIEEKGTHGPSVTMSDPSLLSLLRGVEVNHRRPNLDALLKEEASITFGRMSVSGKCANLRHVQATYRPAVCGSRGIARAVRRALRFPVSGLSTGGPSVTLHVESFGYA